MKKIRKIILLAFLLVLLIYVTNITSIPSSIVLFEGENLNLETVIGVYVDKGELNKEYKVLQVSSDVLEPRKLEKNTAKLKLFNIIPVKEIQVNTIPKTTVIPLGNTIGLKLYTSGVLVIGKSKINGKEPYKNSGIEEGDLITKINENEITCTSDLIQVVSNSNGSNLEIEYVREGIEYSTTIEPAKGDNNEYKLGLWVRDGAAGIGTITYYEPSAKTFGALGHGILDIDTEKLITISSGEVVTSKIFSIVKGEKGTPGELRGSITNGETIGKVGNNTEFGIYGNLSNTNVLNISNLNEIEVASREEIKKGEAKILLTLDDGVRKEYSIEIKKIYLNNNETNKSMLIKVTDNELLEKTGGIIQRYERSTNNSKWEIYRSNNTCVSFRSNRRLCSIWRFNDKRIKTDKLELSQK